MTDIAIQEFWKMRSARYNQLNWATANAYVKQFLDSANFQKTDNVLDAGCGTGIITKLVAPHVQKIVGLDISDDMLAFAKKETLPNESYMQGDMTALPFEKNSFDKIAARMVFHHLMEKIQQGADECFRVLKPMGEIIVSDGVPPGEEIADWYTRMFVYKEERLTLSEKMLVELLTKAGFGHIHVHRYIMPQVSIKNWLENSGIPAENQRIIMEMHRTMPAVGQKLYNTRFTDDDVLLDMHFLTIVAQKPNNEQ